MEERELIKDVRAALSEHNEHIKQAVRETVNGKIDKLSKEFSDWRSTEQEKRMAIEKKLDDYMETTKPMIDFFDGITLTKKMFLWVAGAIATVGGAYLIIQQIFRK